MIPSRPDPVNTGVGIVNHYTRPFPSALLLHHLSNCTMKRKTILPVAVLSLATTLPQHAEASRRAEQDSLSTHRLEEVQVTATRASEKTPMTLALIFPTFCFKLHLLSLRVMQGLASGTQPLGYVVWMPRGSM